MTPTIRECPFCGQADNPAPVVGDYNGYFSVACEACSAEGPPRATEERAVLAWNTRPFVLAEPPRKLEFVSIPPSEDEPAASPIETSDAVKDELWRERFGGGAPSPSVADLREPEVYRRALDVATIAAGFDWTNAKAVCDYADEIAAERERRRG
jgi:Lar family restriction alleviation protein